MQMIRNGLFTTRILGLMLVHTNSRAHAEQRFLVAQMQMLRTTTRLRIPTTVLARSTTLATRMEFW